jgi:hypothetical protein
MNGSDLNKRSLLKRLVFFLFPFCLIIFSNLSTYNARQSFRTTNDTVIGMLQYLPEDYDENSDKYPLVIFLHGIIEKGIVSTDPLILESSIHPVDNLGPPKHVREGHDFPFILISPQLKNCYETWPSWYVIEVIEWAKENLRVDEKRIHITGLSLGGGGSFTAIEDYPGLFASAAPVCANSNSPSKACTIAEKDPAIWAFHGEFDPEVPFTTTSNMINAIKDCSPLPTPNAKVTIYHDLKHNVWDRAYRVDHEFHAQNLYDWMMAMRNTRNGMNDLPFANAGEDRLIATPGSFSLHGSGTDGDGRITAYRWTKISGPLASLSSPDTKAATVSVVKPGSYVFKLTVTDDKGDTDSDYVRVTVAK